MQPLKDGVEERLDQMTCMKTKRLSAKLLEIDKSFNMKDIEGKYCGYYDNTTYTFSFTKNGYAIYKKGGIIITSLTDQEYTVYNEKLFVVKPDQFPEPKDDLDVMKGCESIPDGLYGFELKRLK